MESGGTWRGDSQECLGIMFPCFFNGCIDEQECFYNLDWRYDLRPIATLINIFITSQLT